MAETSNFGGLSSLGQNERSSINDAVMGLSTNQGLGGLGKSALGFGLGQALGKAHPAFGFIGMAKGLSNINTDRAVAREKVMNQNPINPEAFSGGAMSGAAAGAVPNVKPSMGGLGALPTPRGAKDMGMPENGMVADLMRRGYTPDMISAMAGGNMPPREDDAMNLERTGPPTITPTR